MPAEKSWPANRPVTKLPAVILLAYGSVGDVLPMAELGAVLARRGHAVHLLCGRLHAPLALARGLNALPLDADGLPGWGVQQSLTFKGPLLWRRVMQAARGGLHQIELIRAQQQAAGAPEPLLVASTFALAGRLAQERWGLKLATVHLSPVCLASAHDAPQIGDLRLPGWLPLPLRQGLWWALERGLFDTVAAPALNALRAELGLAPVRRVLGRWVHSPDRVLGLFPAWFAPPQPDWPRQTRLVGFPMADAVADGVANAGADSGADVGADVGADPELAEFLAAGPPPVVFYPGSARREAQAFFERALAASAGTGQRAVLLTRYGDQVLAAAGGRLPAQVLHRKSLPFAWLLPRAAALVHCGGVGSLAQALAAGCPQLILPHHFDQFDNAARLQRLGLAQVLRAAPRLPQALGELLADGALRRATQARCAGWPPHAQALDQAADAVAALAD